MGTLSKLASWLLDALKEVALPVLRHLVSAAVQGLLAKLEQIASRVAEKFHRWGATKDYDEATVRRHLHRALVNGTAWLNAELIRRGEDWEPEDALAAFERQLKLAAR